MNELNVLFDYLQVVEEQLNQRTNNFERYIQEASETRISVSGNL